MKINAVLFLLIFVFFSAAGLATEPSRPTKHEPRASVSSPHLTEPGNDIFGTIQEVIAKLNADPNTDWRKVDVEALRQHLLDMRDIAVHADVVSQEPIPQGLKIVVKPTTARADQAMERVFAAHPRQLKREAGWEMAVEHQDKGYVVRATTEDREEISKIRGLGYIGLMAYGAHHQAHHWAIATGKHPHGRPR